MLMVDGSAENLKSQSELEGLSAKPSWAPHEPEEP